MTQIQSVHKFGGSSLKSAERFHAIANILDKKAQVIVVSAIANTTRVLRESLYLAVKKQDVTKQLSLLKDRHTDMAAALLTETTDFLERLEKDLEALSHILHAVHIVGRYTDEIEDVVLSYGELWSSHLTALFLGGETHYVDAANILSVEKKNGLSVVDWESSQKKLDTYLSTITFDNLVITGYTAANKEGHRITLGFNGSDHSAAIFAKLFKVKSLTIWTDVDGIFTADPRIVKQAHVLDALSYEEATELAYFGAKVIHPQAMQPAMDGHIPIHIKNSYNPDAKGTCISERALLSPHEVRGLTAIESISLINVEGTGMTGVSGISMRIFDAINLAELPVYMITQASSEHSICFAVDMKHAEVIVGLLKETLQFEIGKGLIEKVEQVNNCAVLAAVGDAMIGKPGISAKLLTHLAKAHINVLAIAQGSSERNITVVIESSQIGKALRVTHAGFYLSNKMMSIGLIGPGNVGKVLLNQLKENVERLKEEKNIDLRIQGLCGSKKMTLFNKPYAFENNDAPFALGSVEMDMARFQAHILSEEPPHAVMIDCSASADVAANYKNFIESGLHIITPNKAASSGPYSLYQELKEISANKHRHYLYETNVCAGLPIIKTLQDLIQTGDEIEYIEGVFSGTLSFIFNELSLGRKFSDVINEAYEKGYTEPDPRDDLSGFDVARKTVCLARELGEKASLEDVEMESILPSSFNTISVADFLKQKEALDALFSKRVESLIKQNKKIAYLGKISSDGKISIGIKEISSDSPFYSLSGTDNMVIFKSRRYQDNPLVVQGPGAGAEVTAAGIFADLLRLVSLVSD
jgi:aspartokinase/homoserine dehydrogenase 1